MLFRSFLNSQNLKYVCDHRRGRHVEVVEDVRARGRQSKGVDADRLVDVLRPTERGTRFE